MDNTSQWFNYLHTQRKLSHQVIKLAGLDVYNGKLKIPVYDIEGKYIFSKYRKAPWDTSNSPKYQYEQGATVSLYGIDHLSDNVVITEGELDTLALISCGFNACSSTGGSLTFQESWAHLFHGKNVTILYDNDEAGIRGAVKAAFILRKFTYRWVQPRMGKDVSDILINYDIETLKDVMVDENKLEFDIPDLTKKKDMAAYRTYLRGWSRTMTNGSIGYKFIWEMINVLNQRLATRKVSKKKVLYTVGTDVERARQYPIENIIEVSRDGFALCVGHNEKTPSLKVYSDNHAYCFGQCGKRFDAIDIAMAKWNCDFKKAVERLNQ